MSPQEIGGITQTPPDIRLAEADAAWSIGEDNGSEQRHAHYREREDSRSPALASRMFCSLRAISAGRSQSGHNNLSDTAKLFMIPIVSAVEGESAFLSLNA